MHFGLFAPDMHTCIDTSNELARVEPDRASAASTGTARDRQGMSVLVHFRRRSGSIGMAQVAGGSQHRVASWRLASRAAGFTADLNCDDQGFEALFGHRQTRGFELAKMARDGFFDAIDRAFARFALAKAARQARALGNPVAAFATD